MSNTTTEPAAAQPPAATTQPNETSTESQTSEVDWKAKARDWEARAKANKAAADELTALRESQKSEAQKAADALAAAQRAAAEAQSRLLAYDVAKDKGIPEWADLLTGSTREEVEARAAEVVKRLSERTEAARKGGPVLPREGTATHLSSTDAERRQFVRRLTGRSD